MSGHAGVFEAKCVVLVLLQMLAVTAPHLACGFTPLLLQFLTRGNASAQDAQLLTLTAPLLATLTAHSAMAAEPYQKMHVLFFYNAWPY